MEPHNVSVSPGPSPSQGGPPSAPSGGLVPSPAQTGSDTSLSEILITLRKRKFIIIAAVLLGLLYGYYKGTKLIAIYEAYGRIEIRAGSSNQFRVGTSGNSDASSGRIPTEVAIIQSDTLLLDVARELDLANNPHFFGPHPTQRLSINDPGIRQGVLNMLNGGLRVQPLPKTDIIRISYDSTDPKLAADIVNETIKAYRKHTFDARIEASDRIAEALQDKLKDLKKRVEDSQAEVLELQKRLGVLGFDPSHNQITSSLDDLTKATADAQIAKILAQSRYSVLSATDPTMIDSMAEVTGGAGNAASALSALRSQLATLQGTYAQMMGYLGPNNPQAKAIQAQINELQKVIDKEQSRVLAQARQSYVTANSNEQQTSAALEREKSEADKLRDVLVAYTIRQREFESDRTLYEGLLQRIRTAGVQAGLESQEIDIVDAAVPPVSAAMESRSSLLTLYGAIGLVAGVILAFVLDNLDTGLRSVAEIETVTGLASLALVPRAKRTAAENAAQTTVQRNISTISNPKSQFAESFRALRTSLLLSTAGHPPQVLLLTSATPSEGKTTVSTNLACVLAQRDVRVLLIDGDLRRPTVHHRFGLNGRVGLTSVLTGSIAAADAIQHVAEVPNLDILPSGPIPPFPTEMLGSSTMLDLLQTFRETYTHIVIDSPPLLSVTDGVVLARESDAVVLIVRHGKSSKHVVRRARDLLLRAGAPLMGIVLNSVDLNSPEYYGYYGYSGYSYGGVDTSSWESQTKDEAARNSASDNNAADKEDRS